MPINYIGTTYLFMGYADKGLWVLADKYGNRFNVPRMYQECTKNVPRMYVH